MADKPSSVARWADVSGDIVAPLSGKQDVGFLPAERPPAQYVNWNWNLAGDWQAYLRDGLLAGAFGLVTAISPAAIAGLQENWNPTDLATAVVVNVALSATASIGGLPGGVDGRMLIIVNTHASSTLSLINQSAGSTAANRIVCSGPHSNDEDGTLDIALRGQYSAAILRYDGASSRWRVLVVNSRSTLYLGNTTIYTSTIHRSSRFSMVSALGGLTVDNDPDSIYGLTSNQNGYLNPDEPDVDPGTSTRRCFGSVPVRADEQLFAIIGRVRAHTAETVSMKLYSLDYNTGTRTQIGSTQTTGTGAANDDTFLIIAPTEDIDDQHFYWVEFSCSGESGNLRIYGYVAQILVP